MAIQLDYLEMVTYMGAGYIGSKSIKQLQWLLHLTKTTPFSKQPAFNSTVFKSFFVLFFCFQNIVLVYTALYRSHAITVTKEYNIWICTF